jgi:hypothetical protein
MDTQGNIYQELFKENQRLASFWVENMFLTTKWWIMLGLFIIPWFVLFLILKDKHIWKKLTAPILFSILFAFFTDYIGVSYGYWYYTAKLTPLSIDVPWDFALTPTIVSFLLLIKPNTHTILKGIVFGVITAFIAEPLFVSIDFNVYLKWKYIYSLPLYFLVFLVSQKLYNFPTRLN